MTQETISVIDVAKKTGRQKQHIFKVLKRLGIASTRERNSEFRNQEIAYITLEEFDLVAEYLAVDQKTSPAIDADQSAASLLQPGVFYLVQLEPEHDPGRFKVGFATSMPERLRALRCSAPFATVVDTWPCKRLWEQTAIDCVCATCERLHTEVFRTDDISKVRGKCDQFFALMPAGNPK